MPAQGLTQPVNPNTIIAQSGGYGQMPANMMAYIQPQYTAAPVDMVLTENVQTLKMLTNLHKESTLQTNFPKFAGCP